MALRRTPGAQRKRDRADILASQDAQARRHEAVEFSPETRPPPKKIGLSSLVKSSSKKPGIFTSLSQIKATPTLTAAQRKVPAKLPISDAISRLTRQEQREHIADSDSDSFDDDSHDPFLEIVEPSVEVVADSIDLCSSDDESSSEGIELGRHTPVADRADSHGQNPFIAI